MKKKNPLRSKSPHLKAALLVCSIVLSSLLIAYKARAQAVYNCPSICKTNYLNIGTGWDHEADTMYKYQQVDQYWKITRAPNTYNIDEMTNPGSAICAYSGTDSNNGWPFPIPGTFNNTYVCMNPFSPTLQSAGNKQFGNCSIQSGEKAYWYERRFSVCADTLVQIGFFFLYTGDDVTQGIDLIGNTTPFFATLSTGCQSWSVGPELVDTVLWLNPGEYTIRAVVMNAYNSYSPPSGTSSHKFQLGGYLYNVLVTENFLVDNKHFGKSVGLCAPAYPPSPKFELYGPSCLELPNTIDTFFIANYHDSIGQNTYTLTGNNLAPFVPFGTDSAYIILDTGTYTITSVDKYGCSWDTTFTLANNPLFSVTPEYQCVNDTFGFVTLETNPKPWNQMGFLVDSLSVVSFIDSVISLPLGIHSIVAKDYQTGCLSKPDTARIGRIPQQILSSATPPCVSGNQVSILWAWGLPVYSPPIYSYQFTSPTNVALTNTGIYTANSLAGVYGDYIVKVTEAYAGCFATDTITIYPTPEPNLTLTSSAGCVYPNGSVTITATAGNPGNYQYQLNGGIPQASNQFVVNASGTYSVNVVAAGNCPSAPATIYIGDCGKCIYGTVPPTAQWFKDINSTSAFPTTVTPTSPIVIDGTLTVDSNLSILNNPNVYFTLYSKIEMQQQGSPIVLTIDNSTLKPCYYWWAGVFADHAMESIDIDNSHFERMTWIQNGAPLEGGINVKNNALLTCTNSFFHGNAWSMVFRDITGSYNAIIENNEFSGMLIPNANSYFGLTGIATRNVSNLKIGSLNQVSSGNHFIHLANGISVDKANWWPYYSTIEVYNNRFSNIKYTNPNATEYTTAYPNGAYSMAGTAIWSLNHNGMVSLTVENAQNDPQVEFINCDRGIVTLNSTLKAKNLIMNNVLLGIVNRTQFGNKYDIQDNYIDNSHLGIQVLAPQYAMDIRRNTVNTRNIPIDIPAQYIDPSMPWVTKKAPIGIDVSYTNTLDVSNNKYIDNNWITVNTIGGIGIRMHNGHAYTAANENVIQFPTNSLASTSDWDISALQGIQIANCSGSSFKNNYVYGIQNPTVWLARNTLGLAMVQSPKCRLTCNKVKYTKFGLYGWGYNQTTDDAVKYNKMNATEFPWLFLDFGSAFPASLGNVGDAMNDNGNEFVSTANPLNWMGNAGMNLNQYKVFRWSNVGLNEWIFTNSGLLTPTESGASTPFAEYQVVDPNVPINDPCADPFFILAGSGDNGVDSSEIAQAIDIVQDSVSYLNYPEVGEWMAKYRLYQTLGTDSALLQSDPDLVYFYNQTQATLMEDIRYTDYLIALLSDSSTTSGNSAQRYTDAVNANNAIANGEVWEMNEHEVNNLRLKLLAGIIDTIGYDTLYADSLNTIAIPRTDILNATEKQWLRSLAYTCPFVGGNAVYKARTLWSMYESDAKYDDRWLCINAQNKGGSPIQDIDSFLNNQLKETISSINMTIPSSPIIKGNTKPLQDGDVVVYPNPASTQLTIEYNCGTEGQFVLFNILGQEVMRSQLSSGRKKVSMLTNDLNKGVYTYKCIFAGCKETNGKLTIQ